MELLLIVLGGALVAEGVLYALFPEQMLRMMEYARQMSPGSLRVGGVIALAVGVVLFYVSRTVA
ncbi:MAG: DUF2065 domain-containing protein [Pseudomonadota bacterium]